MTSTQAIGDLLDHIGFRKEPDESGAVTWELPVALHVVNTSGGLQGAVSSPPWSISPRAHSRWTVSRPAVW